MANKLFHAKALVTKVQSETDGVIEAVVGSSNVVDRMGEVIDQDGWVLDNYLTNPVILWGHNIKENRPPIGKALKVWIEGKQKKTKKLMFKIQFDLLDSFAAEIYRKVKDGFVNTVSVGFIPLEWDDNTFTKSELLELSFVPVPANPEALVSLRGLHPVKTFEELFPVNKDVLTKEEETVEETETEETVEEPVEDKTETVEETATEEKPETEETATETTEAEETDETNKETVEEDKAVAETVEEGKGVIPFADHGVAPETESWDGPGEMAKCKEITDLKSICAWFDDTKPDNRGSYKLPHHEGESKKAVWRGVSSAMAALLGARGGAELPAEDKKGVYNHLAKHYKQFNKEVPDFKLVEAEVLKGLDEEILTLTLDREDKYSVRLLKKLIKLVKEQNDLLKSVSKPVKTDSIKSTTDGVAPEIVAALQVIDKALSITK